MVQQASVSSQAKDFYWLIKKKLSVAEKVDIQTFYSTWLVPVGALYCFGLPSTGQGQHTGKVAEQWCLRLFKVIALLKDTSAGQVVCVESCSNSSFIHSKNSKAAACCFTLIRPYKTNIPQKNPGWERNEKTRPAWNKPKTLYALINSRWLTLTLTSWEAKERARESVERMHLPHVC